MILLYLDESGVADKVDDYFVVGGIAVHESDLPDLRSVFLEVVARYLDPHLRGIEFHASAVRSGRGPWRSIPLPTRIDLLCGVASELGRFCTASRRRTALFGIVREPGSVPHVNPAERVFEELCLRFNSFLGRRRIGSPEFGMIVADKAKYESVVQPMVNEWREFGTRFGPLRNIVEVPLFVDSEATRMIQLADLVAHSLWLCYARNDPALLDLMLPGFDTSDKIVHGLVHLTSSHRTCICVPCRSRRRSAA